MVRQVTDAPTQATTPGRTCPRTPSWKAVLAVTVAGAALLWHVLACTESPMAFRPGSKDLAFTVMSPYDEKNLVIAGTHVYRLMILTEGKAPRVVEQTDRFMLTAPAYSPDGKYLAYLRIPLLASEKVGREIAEQAHKRVEALSEKLTFPLPAGEGEPQAKPADGNSAVLALPPLDKVAEFYKSALAGPMVPVRLVVRDAGAPDVVIATIPIDLPVFDFAGGGEDQAASQLFAYLLTRPQYSPDGKWVHFCLGRTAVALDPRTGDTRLLAAPAGAAELSPDGAMLAIIQSGALTFVRTDGSRALSLRREADISASGLAWADKDTLALLSTQRDAPRLELLRTDGSTVREVGLPKPEKTGDHSTGELALAPDGRHVVVAYGQEVHFLSRDGKLLQKWTGEKVLLCQPTFSPDGKQVAFKQLDQHAEKPVVTHIVFFSPEGKELSSVALPPPAAGKPETKPTTRLARQTDG